MFSLFSSSPITRLFFGYLSLVSLCTYRWIQINCLTLFLLHRWWHKVHIFSSWVLSLTLYLGEDLSIPAYKVLPHLYFLMVTEYSVEYMYHTLSVPFQWTVRLIPILAISNDTTVTTNLIYICGLICLRIKV